MGDYRIRDFLYNFNRHSKEERTNGVHFKKGERTIGSDHMKTLCIICLYIYLITINENNNTDVGLLFMLLAQIKRIYTLPTRRTCAPIRRTSYRMLVQEIVWQSHHSAILSHPHTTLACSRAPATYWRKTVRKILCVCFVQRSLSDASDRACSVRPYFYLRLFLRMHSDQTEFCVSYDFLIASSRAPIVKAP